MCALANRKWSAATAVTTTVLLLLACAERAAEAHGGHESHDQAKADAPPVEFNPDELWDSQVLRNTEHIQEDLEEFFNMKKEDLSNLTSKELEYYYFELHDFDKNRKLDGLELLKAVIHMIEHGAPDVAASANRIDDFAAAIDQVLTSDDLDRDGYLSYAEFVLTMKKNEGRAEQARAEQARAEKAKQKDEH